MEFLDDQDYQAHGYATNIVGTDLCVPYSYHGVNFPQGVRLGLGPWFDAVLDRVVPLIEGGIHPGPPGVAGTWGAENRANVNDPSKRSFHAAGGALDLNAPWNPNKAGWQDGKLYGVPSTAGPILRELGGLSGGEWGDPMHLECHTTLDEVAARFGPHHPQPAPDPHPALHPFPLPTGYYFGPLAGPAQSISGQSSTEGSLLAAHRAEIAELQTALNRALVAARQTELLVDGQFGPHTQNAVRWFQATHNLAVDGLAGPRTWAKIGA